MPREVPAEGIESPDREGEERCDYCGEWRGPDNFEDGLRCKICAEEQDEGPEDAS